MFSVNGLMVNMKCEDLSYTSATVGKGSKKPGPELVNGVIRSSLGRVIGSVFESRRVDPVSRRAKQVFNYFPEHEKYDYKNSYVR